MNTSLGGRLGLALDSVKLNNSSLAKGLGVSPASVSGWMSNSKTPTIEHLVAISNLLNVSLCWLIAEQGPMHLQGPLHITREEEALILSLRKMPDGSSDQLINVLAHLSNAGSKQALEARAQAAKTLQAAQLAMILFNQQYQIIDINNAYLDLLKIPSKQKADIIGTSFLDWVTAPQRIDVQLTLKNIAQKHVAVSIQCDHIHYQSTQTSSVYLNGTYKNNDSDGLFLVSAFLMPV